MHPRPPDLVLLVPEWPERALLRAQLIEEGYEVISVDTWPLSELYRRAPMKPRVLVIDLRGLPDPRETLEQVRLFLPPDQVLVVTVLGSIAADDVRQLGFQVIERPLDIGEIIRRVRTILSRTPRSSA
jgi:DNA-binding response OmpR family regulator